jgi:hypothetical protein
MIGARVLHARDSETGGPRAQAEIDVLEREKVRLVQQADLLEDLAPDEHHAPADRIDHANGIGTESSHARRRPMAHPLVRSEKKCRPTTWSGSSRTQQAAIPSDGSLSIAPIK